MMYGMVGDVMETWVVSGLHKCSLALGGGGGHVINDQSGGAK